MPVVRQLVALLGFSAPLILLTHSPAPRERRPSFSVAQAQSESTPARLEFYLPPARITPPVPRPLSVARPQLPLRSGPPFLARYAVEPPRRVSIGGARPHAGRAERPTGLFTTARVGRLLYRKGYLGGIPVHLVVGDLRDPHLKLGVLVARAGIGSTESFASMIHRARPEAAITGTFFGVHTGLPTGDLVVNGHALYRGFVGTAIAFTGGNLVSFIRTGYKEKTAWRFFDGVMRAGPLLVEAGRIVLGPRHEGFVSLSPAARRPRTAVGITASGKLLLLAVKEPISLWRLAKLMRTVGAYHAVAMDGGSSTGLYFHGQMVAQPARVLTNALVIYSNRRHDRQAKQTFSASSLPPTVPASPPPSGPALVLRVQSAADNQTRQTPGPQDVIQPAAPLPAGSAPPLASTVPLAPGAASPSAAESLPSGASRLPLPSAAGTSGTLNPMMPGKPTPSTSETARSPAPGAG